MRHGRLVIARSARRGAAAASAPACAEGGIGTANPRAGNGG